MEAKTVTPLLVNGISASTWTGENLLSLGLTVILKKALPWNGTEQSTASTRVKSNSQLVQFIRAVPKKKLNGSFEDISTLLERHDCQIGFSFYSSLQEQLSRRLFANEAQPIVLITRELRRLPPVQYYPDETTSIASASVENLSVVNSEYDPAADSISTTSSVDLGKPPIKDELVTTSAGIEFIKVVIVLLQANGKKRSHGTEYSKPGISQNYYAHVRTRAGSYNCKTDGSVHVMTWSRGIEKYRDDVVLFEIEARLTAMLCSYHNTRRNFWHKCGAAK